MFNKYKGKDINFLEIGVQNGGSLEIWKNYFGENSKIIGIDLNPSCKKFEKDNIYIEIGSQSDQRFWADFFSKYGMIDIVLDDGGHTNYQQIVTLDCCIKKIKDGGLLITEDTHTSYIDHFSNPNKYSFINFSKKIIDDVNFKFPNIGRFKNSYNDIIYSIEFFESIVAFKVDRSKCKINENINNSGISENIRDMRYEEYSLFNIYFSKIRKFIIEKIKHLKLKKYFD